jgi:hypothetical protein
VVQEGAVVKLKSPEQALKDSGLAELGPSEVQDFTLGPVIDMRNLPRDVRVEILGEQIAAMLDDPEQPTPPSTLKVLSVNHETGVIVIGED